MKKNWIIRCGVPIHVLKKVFLVMKLTFLLMIMLQVSTWATGFSQESRVSLQMKDVSLEKVILELRDQTGIRFFYSIDKIKSIEHLSIIKGDTLSMSIAAASILAKVTRDHLMIEYAKKYPQYGFEKHKGYVTKAHKEALAKYGPCPIHRKSFKPVQMVMKEQMSFDI